MPSYRMIDQQFCGEKRLALQRTKAALADAAVRPCSACTAQPQVMHCAYVVRERWDKLARVLVDVYCEEGYCRYHQEAAYAAYEDEDAWYCVMHRPDAQRELA